MTDIAEKLAVALRDVLAHGVTSPGVGIDSSNAWDAAHKQAHDALTAYDANRADRAKGAVTDGESQTVVDDDGCPTEMAVLKRFWRSHHFLESMPMLGVADGWQPIETAPKDGTSILVSDGSLDECAVVAWDNGKWVYGWHRHDGPMSVNDPTHWMPLRAAPVEDEPIYYCTHCKLPNHAGWDHADCEDAHLSRELLPAAPKPEGE